MKLISANIQDLQSLYVAELKKALDMEQKIVDALPDLIDSATDTELREAFRTHFDETKGHVARIESLLELQTGEASTETCKVMNGLSADVSDTITDVKEPSIRDIALIGAAQQVEHHEIAVYGALRRWAQLLGFDEDAAILESIEAEEMNADQLLTGISVRVNLVAAA